jgi:hypothetical protein
MNMSPIIGARKEGLTFLLSIPVQRKRKRHKEKKREGKSARLSAKLRGG